MKKYLIILLIISSCSSEFNDNDPIVLEREIIIRDTITNIIRDTIKSVTIDTVYVTKIDTVFKTQIDTLYIENTIYQTDTIFRDVKVEVKFLYHNADQQVVTADTIYLDGSEVVTWDVTQYDACIDVVKFELK